MNPVQQELHLYEPALSLDSAIGKSMRGFITFLYDVLLIVLFGLGVVGSMFWHTSAYFGIFCIALGLYIPALLFSFYYRMLYFRGSKTVIHDGREKDNGFTYEVASVLSGEDDDVTKHFLTSSFGRLLSARLEIAADDVVSFLASPRTIISRNALELPSHEFLTIEGLGHLIGEHDHALLEFLFARGIQKETYQGAISWVGRVLNERKQKERWWSRDMLARVKGLGADFSYGVAYELRHFLKSLDQSGLFGTLAEDSGYGRKEVGEVEAALSRARGANAFLVGTTELGIMDVVLQLARDIDAGESLASVQGKKIVVFDAEAFVATHDSKQEFEPAFLKMFFEAARAGNLIVVFQNLPQFMKSVEAIGADVSVLMERFLSSPELHIIATSSPEAYHQEVEARSHLLSLFSVVHVDTPSLMSTVRVLEDVVSSYERKDEVRVSYPALVSIAESADRYIVEGAMPDKAVDLLVELIPAAGERGILVVTKDFVTSYVSGKTGIPTGPVDAKERDVLLHLEEVLHARVIGQEHAISMIANAMRRARSGIGTKDRPMGTFLFLGPTGVGKTESAKALAHVFFGDEHKMLRLDMSEFSDASALARLLGEGNAPGILANMLREHPYSVLLIDEFEKSSPDVRNLFLQILDEGIFTDARGVRVNARNSIIIATSNAGSGLIFDTARRGEKLADKKDDIINAVIHAGVYTPELINRFDGVVLFDPLGAENQKQIAELMLRGLTERIKEKGYNLTYDDSLLTYLVEKGHTAEFGARPMRRLIQDIIEEKVAEKIIAGSVKPGDTIGFTARDLPV